MASDGADVVDGAVSPDIRDSIQGVATPAVESFQ
jgi:hypothetical protein